MNDWLQNNKLIEEIQNLNNNFKTFLDGIKAVILYISHPKLLLAAIWNFSVSYSFSICLIVCMFAMILYVLGIKRASKWVKISFFSYLTIQVFNSIK